jgi:uncharacterized protein (TIGR02001 family)
MVTVRRSLVLLACLTGARASCAGVPWDDFGGSLALTTDYVFHGISQTCGEPAAQGDVHFRSAGGESAAEAFAGVWGSVGLGQSGCDQAREINFYGGYSLPITADSNATLTYTHYGYPGGGYAIGRLAGYRFDYDALEAQWAWQDQVYLSVAWTPNALHYEYHEVLRNRSALSYGLQLHQPLPGGFSLSAGIGYDQIADPFGTGYGFWNAGLGYGLGKVQLQASYIGTADRALGLFGSRVAGSRGLVSAVWRF